MPRLILLALVFLLPAPGLAPALAEIALEIGPDTTVIDGPINPDGTINYLAYLNEKLSEGVTPENNFAVDVAMVMSEESWQSAVLREKTLRGLGITQLPADRPVLVQFGTYLGSDFDNLLEDPDWQKAADATTHPWSVEEYPQVKRWIEDQADVLDIISKRISKTHFSMPLNIKEGDEEVLGNIPLPWLGIIRSLARVYTARAQFSVGDGDLSSAWNDFLVVHKMAKHLEDEPFIISWIVADSVHKMSWLLVDDIASSEHLRPEQVKDMLADLRLLEPLSPFGVSYDLDRRLSMLDAVCRCASGLGGGPYLSEAVCANMASEKFDVNAALRMVNSWVDRFSQAAERGDFKEREAALIGESDNLEEHTRLAMQLFGEHDGEAAKQLEQEIVKSNKYTVAVMYRVIYQMLDTPENLSLAAATDQMRLALAPVVLAIGGYHAEHGEFPTDLSALVPAYLDSLPIDFATGELPVYRVEDGAAIVYSLGTNMEDDGGLDDLIEGDIVFRIER